MLADTWAAHLPEAIAVVTAAAIAKGWSLGKSIRGFRRRRRQDPPDRQA